MTGFSTESSSPNMQIQPKTYQVTAEGHTMIGGMNVVNLAKTYGTPLYVIDEATFKAMAAVYRNTLEETYSEAALALYACKANMNLGLVRLAEQEGLGLDVVSGGELYTALQAEFPVEKIFFNGNNKTIEELTLAIDNQIGRITVDNFHELNLIHQIAAQKNCKVPVLLRVTPGIDCHTHDYIRTGHIDSKFGFDLSYLSNAIDDITGPYKDTIELKGLHAHIGSQIFEIKPYEDLIEILLNIFYNIRENYGLTLTDLNLGGGMGIAYSQADDPPNVAQALTTITQKVESYSQTIDYPLPRLVVEPGRSMIATSGVTLYTIGSIKEVPGIRTYVAIDGGMGDNIRPALYQAKYSAIVANKANSPNTETVTIAGKYCESGDVLLHSFETPKLEAGDTLMVFGTGAYNYSMSSNYNRMPRPAMVLVSEGAAYPLVKRETYDHLLQQDLIPTTLLKASPEVSLASS